MYFIRESLGHAVIDLFCFYVKLELSIIQALESGSLTHGGVVTEGSAGSTAISLATVASAYGCKCHVVIPDDAAIEKVNTDSNLVLEFALLDYPIPTLQSCLRKV